jgi:hypothetical protein
MESKGAYYDAEAQVECYVDEDSLVRIILPSAVNLTPDQARRFGTAVVAAAEMAERNTSN